MTSIAVTPNKICPVIFRNGKSGVDILAFRHPLAGSQLVKGSIEPGETLHVAALRELAEESGIVDARIVRDLGIWQSGFQQQVWAFVEVDTAVPLPDRWQHAAPDDGGHVFEFFWQPLVIRRGAEWHSLFDGAMRFLASRLIS